MRLGEAAELGERALGDEAARSPGGTSGRSDPRRKLRPKDAARPPRCRARRGLRAAQGAPPRLQPPRAPARALGRTGQHCPSADVSEEWNSLPLPSPTPRTKLEAETRGRKCRGRGPSPAPSGRRMPARVALTMSYTLSTTNWLAPILLPAAAASSSSRSVSAGPRPLPPPRALQGARAGHYAHSPARGSRRGSIGQPGRSRAPPTGPSAPTGPDRWRARSGSGASPRQRTRGERQGLSGEGGGRQAPRGRGRPGAGAEPACALAPRGRTSGPKMAPLHAGGAGSQKDYSSRHAVRTPRLPARSAEAQSPRLRLPACRGGPAPCSSRPSRETTAPSMQCLGSAPVFCSPPLAAGEVLYLQPFFVGTATVSFCRIEPFEASGICQKAVVTTLLSKPSLPFLFSFLSCFARGAVGK